MGHSTIQKEFRENKKLPRSIEAMLTRLNKYKRFDQSIIASHLWFNICDHHPREDLVELKAMIKYNRFFETPTYISKLLQNYGFREAYSDRAVASMLKMPPLDPKIKQQINDNNKEYTAS